MSTDHNLLFGVLALQADFLDAAQFAEACSAWAGRKDVPLAELLVERGWLSDEDRRRVEGLLQRKLNKHGGDVRASLAEVTTDQVRQSLAGVAALPSPVQTTAHHPEGRGRYTLTHLHASGGIGQVWLARDADLGRDIALKELLPERMAHPTARARFLEEACITGQLEHPGIVPVHELVRDADGRPFYTMRMVRGRTLGEAIRDYHRKRQAGEAGPLEQRALLTALVAVCNAVAYAHSRGVLHRDLKPGNVVLGDYGEVVVLDWGLAKVLGQRDEQVTNLLPVSLEACLHDETMQGQVLGTPAYMAPEQAEGQVDLLGPATDVYGLGAILYEILTGQPPFSGEKEEVLRRVAREEPERPRQHVSTTPRPLEAVCLKALAKKPGERYATAGELAREVERWLADEPVAAWREPWRARAGRWVRRHQPLVAALAAGLVVVLLVGGGAAVWLGREQERQRAATESALERVASLQQEARWEEARGILDHAEARLGDSGSAGLRRRLTLARADLDLVARLDAIQFEYSRLTHVKLDADVASRAYADAFEESGFGEVGDDEAAVAARLENSAVREALVAALDHWAMLAGPNDKTWILGVARRADPHPWRDRLRDPAMWRDERRMAELVGQVPPADMTPRLAAAIGRLLSETEQGEALLRAAQGRQPGDFWLNFNLVISLMSRDKPQEAEGFGRAAVALRPNSSGATFLLGTMLDLQGKVAEAEKLYRKTLDLTPKNAMAYNSLGSLVWRQGRVAEAEQLYRTALQHEPGNATASSYLGASLTRRHADPAEAEKLLRRALEVDPKNATALNFLGWLRERQGKPAEAEKLYREALRLNPKDAFSHRNLGSVLFRRGNQPEGARHTRKAIELDPKNKANFFIGLGLSLNSADAEKSYQAVVPKLPALLKGEYQPRDNAERLAFAGLCHVRGLYRASARLYADAFAADAKAADDLEAAHRYNAACHAALAGCGRGEDEPKSDDEEKARLRGQALAWLRADLALRQRQVFGDKAARAEVQAKMKHWLKDPDLDGVRGEEALAALPAPERPAWAKLWADVEALLAKAGAE